MTKADSVPFWLPPISLFGIALLIGFISFSPWAFEPFVVTGQAFLLIAGLRFFCYWPPMVRWVTAMPVVHRVVFAVSVAGIILGHYTIKSRAYFPFVAWEIFPDVKKTDPVTCREFIATTASGRKVRLLVEQLFPSIVQIDQIEYPPLDNGHYPPGAVDHLAHVLAKAYNACHTDDPVQQVDLMLMAVPLHPSTDESRTQPSCELLKSYNVSLDP